jgi:nitrate reductase delta subunit
VIKTYKILSILLSYPEKEIHEFLPEVVPNLRSEGILEVGVIDGIGQFCEHFQTCGLIDWQEHYVQLFDHSRAVSLNLFEHVHGDSKDRGQAMVDLMQFYNENGLEIKRTELPDYLPAFLEFLSLQEPVKAAELLADPAEIIDYVLTRLKESGSHYQNILSAIISLHAREQQPGRQPNND